MTAFDTAGPVRLRVRVPAGTLAIAAEDTAVSTVDVRPVRADDDAARRLADRTLVDLHGDELVVDVPDDDGDDRPLSVTVTVPRDSAVQARTASAGVRCRGRLSRLDCDTASGGVAVEQLTGDAGLHTASGRIELGEIGGQLRVRSASGCVAVETVLGDAEISTASGAVQLGRADASVHARTASGGLTVACAAHGDLRLDSASGDVRVGVRPGTTAWLDLATVSGRTRRELDDVAGQAAGTRCDVNLRVRTASGDIHVFRAGTG